MRALFLDDTVELMGGDCLDVVRGLADNSIDSVVTDPPYELGFMGKGWDATGIANNPALWAEVLRVLKPGGHVAAFSGTRTYHRMACAIEDAGFEIRDQLAWCYGTGFPKVGYIRDGDGNVVKEGWGGSLKPSWEPICLARKPLSEKTVAANVLRWGTGAINVDGCRVATTDDLNGGAYSGGSKDLADATSYATGVHAGDFRQPLGRFPANLCHDGSDEVLAAFPHTKSGLLQTHHVMRESENNSMSGKNYARSPKQNSFGDEGSAARFFYSAKASKADRAGSKHPTVKPVKLMQWLVRLITPPGGTTLDPFAGSGTTGEAAWREGFKAVLIERETEYQDDIARRFLFL